MSTIINFPPRSALAERTVMVEMEGPSTALKVCWPRCWSGSKSLAPRASVRLPTIEVLKEQSSLLRPRSRRRPLFKTRPTTPNPRMIVKSMQTPLLLLNDLMRGLMALMANCTGVSELQVCYSLASNAQMALDELWDMRAARWKRMNPRRFEWAWAMRLPLRARSGSPAGFYAARENSLLP